VVEIDGGIQSEGFQGREEKRFVERA